ncbi:MAG: sugar transferase [Acidobacteriota bacterium]
MLKQHAREIGVVITITDVCLLTLAFLSSCVLRFTLMGSLLGEQSQIQFRPYVWFLWASVPLLLYLFNQAGLYDSLRRMSHLRVAWLTLRPFLVAAMLMGLAIFLVQDKAFSRSIFLGYFVIGALAIIVEKLVVKHLASRFRARGFNTRTVLIIGANADSVAIARELRDSPEYGYVVRGHLMGYDDGHVDIAATPILGQMGDLQTYLDREAIDEVIIAVPYAQVPAYEWAIRLCEEVGVRVHLKIDPIGALLSRTYVSEFGRFAILTMASTSLDPIAVVTKRALDLTVSTAALILAAPLMMMTWLAVRFTSPGPAIFKQVRGGLNGRRFVFYKFRSMYVDAEPRLAALQPCNEMSGPVFKMTHDPRVTPVGHFIRKWSIDELPQLFNVLKGDMSLVGPRPPIPDEVDQYERWQKRRLSMKPGITCLWQVNGRNRIGFDEWMKLDMEYIDDWSLGLDLKILAKTIPAVLFARGAR